MAYFFGSNLSPNFFCLFRNYLIPFEPKRHCPRHNTYLGRRCQKCEKERNQKRGSASSRGYDKDWKRVRAEFLLANPMCSEPNCEEFATDVDHIISLADGGERLDPKNLRSFCHSHHSQRTNRDQVKWNRKKTIG